MEPVICSRSHEKGLFRVFVFFFVTEAVIALPARAHPIPNRMWASLYGVCFVLSFRMYGPEVCASTMIPDGDGTHANGNDTCICSCSCHI